MIYVLISQMVVVVIIIIIIISWKSLKQWGNVNKHLTDDLIVCLKNINIYCTLFCIYRFGRDLPVSMSHICSQQHDSKHHSKPCSNLQMKAGWESYCSLWISAAIRLYMEHSESWFRHPAALSKTDKDVADATESPCSFIFRAKHRSIWVTGVFSC